MTPPPAGTRLERRALKSSFVVAAQKGAMNFNGWDLNSGLIQPLQCSPFNAQLAPFFPPESRRPVLPRRPESRVEFGDKDFLSPRLSARRPNSFPRRLEFESGSDPAGERLAPYLGRLGYWNVSLKGRQPARGTAVSPPAHLGEGRLAAPGRSDSPLRPSLASATSELPGIRSQRMLPWSKIFFSMFI